MSSVLLNVFTSRLSSQDRVYLKPDIPPRKLRSAREAHHLAEELILVLYDDTMFGSGKDGFVLTASGIHWKNFLEEPQCISYAQLDPETLSVSGFIFELAGGQINITMSRGLQDILLELLQKLAKGGQQDAESGPSAAMSLAQQISREALAVLGKADKVFIHPNIPPRKLSTVRKIHAGSLEEGEPILVLFDNTVFGGGSEGFLITPQRLCWRNTAKQPNAVRWTRLDRFTIQAEKKQVMLHKHEISMNTQAELTGAAAELFIWIATLVQERGSVR